MPILPPPEEGHSLIPDDVNFLAVGTLSGTFLIGLCLIQAPQERSLEPVGPHFLAHARRKRHNRTFSEDEKHEAEIHAASLEDKSGNVSEDEEPEDPEMLKRDPKEWKVRRIRKVANGAGTRSLRSPRIIEI